jgi:hypothetical protein
MNIQQRNLVVLVIIIAAAALIALAGVLLPSRPTPTETPASLPTRAFTPTPLKILPTNTPAPTITLAPTYTPLPEETSAPITPTPANTALPITPTVTTAPTIPIPIGGITEGFSLTMTRILSLTAINNLTPTEYADLLWADEILAFEEEQADIKQYDLYKVGYPLIFCTKIEGDTGVLEIELLDEDGSVMGSYIDQSIRFTCRVLGSSPDWSRRPIFAKVTPTKGKGFTTENLLWSVKVWRVGDIRQGQEKEWGVVKGSGDAVFLPFNTQEAWGYYDSTGDAIEILYLCEGEELRRANTRNRIPFTLPNECYGMELNSADEWYMLLNQGNDNAKPTPTAGP